MPRPGGVIPPLRYKVSCGSPRSSLSAHRVPQGGSSPVTDRCGLWQRKLPGSSAGYPSRDSGLWCSWPAPPRSAAMPDCDVLVVGSGPCGTAAATALVEAGAVTVMVDGGIEPPATTPS